MRLFVKTSKSMFKLFSQPSSTMHLSCEHVLLNCSQFLNTTNRKWNWFILVSTNCTKFEVFAKLDGFMGAKRRKRRTPQQTKNKKLCIGAASEATYSVFGKSVPFILEKWPNVENWSTNHLPLTINEYFWSMCLHALYRAGVRNHVYSRSDINTAAQRAELWLRSADTKRALYPWQRAWPPNLLQV